MGCISSHWSGPPKRPLTEYFRHGYLAGEVYNGPRYAQYSNEDSQLPLIRHTSTGVNVWSEALDLRSVAPNFPSLVLYYYTDRAEFEAVTTTRKKDEETIQSLADRVSDFGIGLCMLPRNRMNSAPSVPFS
jgi:hypothetical protein